MNASILMYEFSAIRCALLGMGTSWINETSIQAGLMNSMATTVGRYEETDTQPSYSDAVGFTQLYVMACKIAELGTQRS